MDRRASLSPLMVAKGKASTGEKVNFCPFGCEQDDIDEHGYCRHLVGFTNDGKQMEPMIHDDQGRKVVQGAKKEPVLKTDKLIQITVSQRVYRESGTSQLLEQMTRKISPTPAPVS